VIFEAELSSLLRGRMGSARTIPTVRGTMNWAAPAARGWFASAILTESRGVDEPDISQVIIEDGKLTRH
jgi:hypothetical protein